MNTPDQFDIEEVIVSAYRSQGESTCRKAIRTALSVLIVKINQLTVDTQDKEVLIEGQSKVISRLKVELHDIKVDTAGDADEIIRLNLVIDGLKQPDDGPACEVNTGRASDIFSATVASDDPNYEVGGTD